MIWYKLPLPILFCMFPALLLTVICQTMIVLEAGELIRDKSALRFIRLLYGLLSATTVVLSLEGITAVASIEGGIYTPISGLFRYVSLLLFPLGLYSAIYPVKVPKQMEASAIIFLIPLLLLPVVEYLPSPLPVAFFSFAAALLLFDAVRMLLVFNAHARTQITRGAVPYIIHNLDHGICVADRRGRILESNPAFIGICESLGVHKTEHIDEFDVALKREHDAGRLKISEIGKDKTIQLDSRVYFLQYNNFRARRKAFMEITISDTTQIVRVALELEQENIKLARDNQRLERLISDIKLDEAIRERESLCRLAHDRWSQRLAVAGLSIDMLLDQKDRQPNADALEGLVETLSDPVIPKPAAMMCNLPQTLQWLTGMYGRLGVEIQIDGQVFFTKLQQEALCSVIREALANAVRHAYARHVTVRFDEDAKMAGMVILNKALDSKPNIIEGRGLYDIRACVRRAGGSFYYKKGATFELGVMFPKDITEQKEEHNESCANRRSEPAEQHASQGV